MYLCIGVVLVGLLCYILCLRKGRQKTNGIYFLILMISGVFGVLVCLNDAGSDLSQPDRIQRPKPGSGPQEEEYVLSVEDLSISEPYRVTVENRHLTKRELEELFTQAEMELERTFLGENETLDHITKNVVLADSVMDGLVGVSWSFDDYQTVNLLGELQEEALSENGSLVR